MKNSNKFDIARRFFKLYSSIPALFKLKLYGFEIGFEIRFKIGFEIVFKFGSEIGFEIGFKIGFEIGFKIRFEIGFEIGQPKNLCRPKKGL